MAGLRRMQGEQGFWSLVGILLAVAIIIVLAVVMFGSNSKISPENRVKQASEESGVEIQGQPEQGVVGAVIDKGHEQACRSNLQQIRTYLTMEQTQNGTFPAVLDARKLGSGSILSCPATNQPYEYDPSSGTVRCSTPGHEGF